MEARNNDRLAAQYIFQMYPNLLNDLNVALQLSCPGGDTAGDASLREGALEKAHRRGRVFVM